MNMLTKTERVELKDGQMVDRPDSRSVMPGTTLCSFNNLGIRITPQVGFDREQVQSIFPKEIPTDALFRGAWFDPIHFEISGNVPRIGRDGRTIMDAAGNLRMFPVRFFFRCQTPTDRTKITNTCPHDMTCAYRIGWKGDKLEMLNTQDESLRPSAEQQEHARVSALFDSDLETQAAQLSVIWDVEASRETMVNRVVEASLERQAARDAAVVRKLGEKEQEIDVSTAGRRAGKRMAESIS